MQQPPEVTIEDIQNNPHKYGVPTFEEFVKNPKKYSPGISEEEHLAIIDNGGQNLKRYTKTKVFQVLDQKFKTLERAQEFCRDHGITIKDWKVVTYNVGGQVGEERVIIMPPEEFERRNR